MASSLIILAGAVAVYLLLSFINILRDPLRDIPGPLAARFTKIWYFFQLHSEHWMPRVRELHRKYNSKIVRYAPGQYSISDPEAIKGIYGHGKDFDKAPPYSAWNPPGQLTLFNEPKSEPHDLLRRKLAGLYSMSSVSSYEEYTTRCAEMFSECLTKRIGQRIDLAWWLHCYAADSMGMLTYGKRFGHLDAGEDIGNLSKSMRSVATYATYMGIFPDLHPYYYWFVETAGKIIPWFQTAKMYLNKFAADTVAQRKTERAEGDFKASTEEGPTTMLDKFLNAEDKNPNYFTMREIMVGLGGNIVAGSDTTTATLTAAMYYLFTNTEKLAKLRAELQGNAPLTLQEAQKNEYLNAVISETLRLYPITGIGLPRVVPPGGAEICGHFFPAGSIVAMSASTVHYNPEYFGPDPETFRPERWLTKDKEEKERMAKAWFPWGLGSRNCLGKNIAMLAMLKVIPVVVERFEVEVLDKKLDSVDHWVVRPRALDVIVRGREKTKA